MKYLNCAQTSHKLHLQLSQPVDTLWAAALGLCVPPTPSAVTFPPSCRWPSDGLPLPGSPRTTLHVTHQLALLLLAADAPVIKWQGRPIGPWSSEEVGGRGGN